MLNRNQQVNMQVKTIKLDLPGEFFENLPGEFFESVYFCIFLF